MNGGPETANLKLDNNVALSAQKRYKIEMQAEISKLRDRNGQGSRQKQGRQAPHHPSPVPSPDANSQKQLNPQIHPRFNAKHHL